MVTQDDATPLEARPPTLEDLLLLCKSLNQAGAKYIVIGGMAVIQHGFTRATGDIDLLVEDSKENIQKVKIAMSALPDQAVLDLEETDLKEYIVVRVVDEFVVDLLAKAGGLNYESAYQNITEIDIQGIRIPFASPGLLIQMKQTYREKDKLDLTFLQGLTKNS
jgi:hypothetical protein